MKRHKNINYIINYMFLLTGALLTVTGLEIFLINNNIIDGGIVGISIMLSYITKLPLGLFIFTLNATFLLLGYNHIGKTFVASTFFLLLPYRPLLQSCTQSPGLLMTLCWQLFLAE